MVVVLIGGSPSDTSTSPSNHAYFVWSSVIACVFVRCGMVRCGSRGELLCSVGCWVACIAVL